MGAQGTFYARVVDTNPKMMTEVFTKAAQHKGTSLIEVLQNCIIFNNKVHADITGKDVREENQIYVEHGKPMIFGKNRDKGLIQGGPKFVVVKIGENGIRKEDILVHNAHNPDDTRHYMLSRMTLPDYPVAMGIIREWKTEVYERMLYRQIREAKKRSKVRNVNDLLRSGNTFKID
jgi:2-oxoglutarate ferredoxin oxidoreductase subunit beta